MSKNFDGFKPIEGNFTMTPNQFFDVVLREKRCVIQVVGLVIRKTLGWQDEYGNRKTQEAVSYKEFVVELGMSKSTVAEGVKIALAKGYLTRIYKGYMDFKTRKSESSVYSLNIQLSTGVRKTNPDTVRKSNPIGVRKLDPDTVRNSNSSIKKEIYKYKDEEFSAVVWDGKPMTIGDEIVLASPEGGSFLADREEVELVRTRT